MPLIYDTAPLIKPSPNAILNKYLDLPKFLSLLYKRSIFFTRLDKLEDRYEGVSSNASRELMLEWYRDGAANDDEANQRLVEYLNFEKQYKTLVCINCWNKNQDESAALWKIYSDFGKGIMIKSSISSVEKALNTCAEDVRISEVKYINHEKDFSPAGNSYFAFIHKNKSYSYEEEIRLIYEIVPEFGWVHDWSKEEVETGKYIAVDLLSLIDEVILGPFSPNWVFEMITDLMYKYGIDRPVRKSKLFPTY